MECLGCSKEFDKIRSHQIYCSVECKKKIYKKEGRFSKEKVKKCHDKKCIFCKKIIINAYEKQKYCNRICRKNYEKNFIYKDMQKYSGLNKVVIGSLHEMLVCVDLLKRGYSVFRSICPSAICDLAILKEDKFLRIEVTTGNLSNITGHISRPKKDKKRFDVLATVLRDGSIIYESEIQI